MSIWIVSAILALALFLLITEKMPVDRTAVGVMVALAVTVVGPSEIRIRY